MGDGESAYKGTILDSDNEHIDLAFIKGLQTAFKSLVGRCGFKLVEDGDAMRGQERIGVEQVLDYYPLILKFFLDRADKYLEFPVHHFLSC